MSDESNPDQATACLWQALGLLAATEAERELLAPGRTKIALAVDAYVADRPIVAVIAGELVVDERISFWPDPAWVLAMTLSKVPFNHRVRLVEDLTLGIAEWQVPPPVASELLTVARRLLLCNCVRFERTVVR